MRRMLVAVALVVMAVAAGMAIRAESKLPKCSMTMCRSVGCSPDVLCASGAHVKTCAEVCNSR